MNGKVFLVMLLKDIKIWNWQMSLPPIDSSKLVGNVTDRWEC